MVAGVSALLIFSQLGMRLSLLTVVLAHITFSISYVTVVVRARLDDADAADLADAAQVVALEVDDHRELGLVLLGARERVAHAGAARAGALDRPRRDAAAAVAQPCGRD